MSLTLLITSLKKNWVLLLIFFSVLTMYTTIMISMYNPEDMSAMSAMLEMFPKELMKAMGFAEGLNSLTTYLASWLYGLLMFAFPMVYCIIISHKLVAKTVDNGSIASILCTPLSRVKLIITLATYSLLSIFILFCLLFAVGYITAALLFPNQLDTLGYLRINAVTMILNMFVIMICFFFSSLFNESKFALGFGAGVPIAFLLMNMLGGASKNAEILKDLSIYGLYDPIKIVNGSANYNFLIIYIAGIIALFVGSILVFKNKRLPI